MKYKNIVWDWNGTLLDDLDTGVLTLNAMLKRRGLPEFTNQKYKDIFRFPVEDFYREAGFNLDKESLHEISVDFVETYDTFAGGVSLNSQVPEVLQELQKRGVRQYVLSALRENILQQMILDFEINPYFEQICGSDNIYAIGKVGRGKRMLETCGINPKDTLMVGDTLHDAEVAEALGFDCILYSGGHNSGWRLQEKATVINELKTLSEEYL